jgi:hypothetical protein
MAELSDKTLPYIDIPLEELIRIDSIQNKNFPNETGRYMNPYDYYSKMEQRKESFKAAWEGKSILSWNYPEYKAYNTIFEKPEKQDQY